MKKSALVLLIALVGSCGSSGDDTGGQVRPEGESTTSSTGAREETRSTTDAGTDAPAGTTETTTTDGPPVSATGGGSTTPEGQGTTTATTAPGTSGTPGSPRNGDNPQGTTGTTAAGTTTSSTPPGTIRPDLGPGVQCREVDDPEKGTYYKCG